MKLKDCIFGTLFSVFVLLAGCENDLFLMWPHWAGVAGLAAVGVAARRLYGSRPAPRR